MVCFVPCYPNMCDCFSKCGIFVAGLFLIYQWHIAWPIKQNKPQQINQKAVIASNNSNYQSNNTQNLKVDNIYVTIDCPLMFRPAPYKLKSQYSNIIESKYCRKVENVENKNYCFVCVEYQLKG